MKQSDLTACALCQQGVMHSGHVTFYRIRLERFLVNIGAVRRQAGLEQMLGSPKLAAVMGPNEEITESLSDQSAIICEECAASLPGGLCELDGRLSASEEQK